MKKIILLLSFVIIPLLGYSQDWTEGFEGPTFPPTVPPTGTSFGDWTVGNNGVGTVQSWDVTNDPSFVCEGLQAAQILRENLNLGETAEDWLVTPKFTIGTSRQLRFFSRSQIVGDQGTRYEIRISSPSATGPTDFANFSTIASFDENQLSQDPAICAEKIISLGAYAGDSRWIAFVRVFTRVSNLAALAAGDKWILDKVTVVEQCTDPNTLVAGNITGTTAVLTWGHPDLSPASPSFDVEYGTYPFTPGTGVGTPSPPGGVGSPFTATGLVPSKENCFFVRARCASGNISNWIGPYRFLTLPLGTICSEPKLIPVLPYQVTGESTSTYGDHIDVFQGASCGGSPSTTNYLTGNEVFYKYTPTSNCVMTVTMTPSAASTNSALFIYSSCANVGTTCLGGVANPLPTPRTVSINATAGQTYYILISSAAATQSITYDLVVQCEDCTPKPTLLGATSELTGAKLSWTDADASHSTWEVAVQKLGDPIPAAHGVYPVTTNTDYQVNTLLDGTAMASGEKYQYWVRAECSTGSGTYSGWTGPFPFNTLLCAPADSCVHTFKMLDSANNGWNGAQMQVIQKSIVVATIGPTFTNGSELAVQVSLCKDVPFDLYWSVPGSQPQQAGVQVINSFGQTIYAIAPGLGTPGDTLYHTDAVNCTAARCDLAPTDLGSISTATHSAILTWSAPATTHWDVYIVKKGSGIPIPSTQPTYDNITVSDPDHIQFQADQFTTGTGSQTLESDIDYEFYVRVDCGGSDQPSAWSAAGSFHTLASCPRPTIPAAPGGALNITTTQATLVWTPVFTTDNSWDIVLVPGMSMTPPTQSPPTNPTGPYYYPNVIPDNPTATPDKAYTVNNLSAATIYYYYVRTICADGDKSVWEGPYVFNTVVCDPANKCNYKFVLTDSGANGWNLGRMQVRQNGILVATIGASITGTQGSVTVPLCTGVPFDLYWNLAGNLPGEIGVSIQNPYGDVLYKKLPGEGSPLDVLFSSTANCVPPTCPKPTGLAIGTLGISSTDAYLTWTETGTAPQWEVYAGPTGAQPPVNGSPLHGNNPPYYIADTNVNFHVTGLNPSTSYTYYVRAICSGGTDIGTWSILTPKTFITKPLNDDCSGSIDVPVNPTRVASVKVAGGTLGATASTPSPVCIGTADDDVWFSFVATAKTLVINIDNITGVTSDMNHAVYKGDDCSSLTQFICSNPNSSVATNLEPGKKYYIRAYTNGSGQTASFSISITTPLPVTNDECATALPAVVNDGIVCKVSTAGSLAGATASADLSTCSGLEDDDVWFSFTATAITHYFELKNVQGSDTNLNFGIYKGTCGSLQQLYCSASNTLVGNSSVFAVGSPYYVRVWSNSSVLQDVTFDLCIGKILPPIKTDTKKYTPTELVEKVLFGTTCASITNVTSSTGTNFGSVNGIGYFEKNGSEFPFKDGVILTSGDAKRAPGPQAGDLKDGSPSWTGDKELADIYLEVMGEQMYPFNASILEFDFVPFADKLSFNFVFSSDEYGTYQCTWGDSFAFILTEKSTGKKQNLAVLPDGAPISVVTIRDKCFNSLCESAHPEFFGQYYGNGFACGGINPLGAPINYNGVAVPMKAAGTVTPGQAYHIKLVIADKGDTWFDSAVFLEGGSFNIGSVDLGLDLTGSSSICKGESVTLHSGLDPVAYHITWYNGATLLGEGADFVVTEPGTYTVKAQYGASVCAATDDIVVEYYQEPLPGTPKDLVVCNTTGVGTFDLTVNTAVILAPLTNLAPPYNTAHTVVYYASQSDAESGDTGNAIANPTAFQNTPGTNPQTIYARVDNGFVSCYQIVTFTVSAQDLSPKFTLSGATSYCPNGSTTISTVPSENSYDPAVAVYTWTFNGNPIIGESSSSLAIATAAGYGPYTVKVDLGGCYSIQSFDITNANSVWDVSFNDTPYEICPGQSIPLSFTAVNFDINDTNAVYTWTAPDGVTKTVGPTVMANHTGTYSLEVDILGCKSTETVEVNENTTQLGIAIESGCDGNDYTLHATAVNDSFDPVTSTFEWTGPDFSVVSGAPDTIVLHATGSYAVKVTLQDGCSSEEPIEVGDISCMIQKGISPNGDGKNDVLKLSDAKKLEIFNRYGKKVYSYTNYTDQWGGQTDGGDKLPDGTYYYVIERNSGKSLTGWIYILHQE